MSDWEAYAHAEPARLVVDGAVVAEYVYAPKVPAERGPRPFLHPVRTRRGTVVTDILPADHPHHLGVSVALADVNGTNLWGGKSYVKGQGYVWLDDRASIEHREWLTRTDSEIEATLRWYAHDGETLLDERRVMRAELTGDAWTLDVAYTLTNPGPEKVTLGSPVTRGRPDKAGYGGFYWRFPYHPEGARGPIAYDGTTDVEDEVNGTTNDWVEFRSVGAGNAPYSLRFEGLAEGDHWFVRTSQFPGVCACPAYYEARVLAPGESLSRHHRVTVADKG